MTKEQHYKAAAILEEIEGLEGHVNNITEVKDNLGHPCIGRMNLSIKFVNAEILDLYLANVKQAIDEKQKELQAT
jgi:predicted transport protein